MHMIPDLALMDSSQAVHVQDCESAFGVCSWGLQLGSALGVCIWGRYRKLRYQIDPATALSLSLLNLKDSSGELKHVSLYTTCAENCADSKAPAV